MTKFADLTLDQIRTAINAMIENQNLALAGNEPGLANAFKDKAKSLWVELVMRLQNEDPWTTEADIRYFEGINI